MSEKPIAVVLAGIGVLSICAVCALGPVALGAAFGWAFGWMTELSPMAIIGAAIFAALFAFGLFRRWGAARPRRVFEPPSLPDPIEEEHR